MLRSFKSKKVIELYGFSLKNGFKLSKALVNVQNKYETLFCFYGRIC